MDEIRPTLQMGDAPVGEMPAAPLRLVLEPSGTVLELKFPDLVMGRHSEADVRLPLPDVSRRHCRLLHVGGRWQVQDLKSLNGVFVNDQPIDEVTLQHGDRLRVGGFTFTVDLPNAATEPDDDGVLRRLVRNLPRMKQGSGPRRKAS